MRRVFWIFLWRLPRFLFFGTFVGLAYLFLPPAMFKRVIKERWRCWGGFHDIATATGYDWYCKREECAKEYHESHCDF